MTVILLKQIGSVSALCSVVQCSEVCSVSSLVQYCSAVLYDVGAWLDIHHNETGYVTDFTKADR